MVTKNYGVSSLCEVDNICTNCSVRVSVNVLKKSEVEILWQEPDCLILRGVSHKSVKGSRERCRRLEVGTQRLRCARCNLKCCVQVNGFGDGGANLLYGSLEKRTVAVCEAYSTASSPDLFSGSV